MCEVLWSCKTPETRNITENFNKSVSNYLSNQFVSISRSSQNVISGSQSISISDLKCSGSINISGISQKSVYTINTDVLSSTVNKDVLKSILSSAVGQAASTVQSASSGFLSGAAGATNIARVITENTQNIVNNYSYSDFQNDLSSIKANQLVNIKGLVSNGTCSITDISQDMVMENLAKNMSNRLTEKVADIANSLTSQQQSSTNQTAASTGALQDLDGVFSSIGDIFSGPIKWVILGILLFVIIMIVAWKLMSSGGESDSYQDRQFYMPNYQQMPPGNGDGAMYSSL
jgi:hypothetical protein